MQGLDTTGFDPGALTRLSDALTRLVDTGRVPGVVAMIVRRGQPAYLEGFGLLDPTRGTAMRADAIFRIHSMTKPIVSVAAMMLVEQGRLMLRDSVAQHLPEFAATRLGVDTGTGLALVPPQRAMTVHDLLRHTAGLTYEFFPPSLVRQAYVDAKPGALHRSNAEQSEVLAGLPLLYEPGSVWEYSRATDVLGRLVEAVTGRPLGDLLQATILGPLGMADTGFTVAPEQHHRIAEPFERDPDSGAPVALRNPRVPAALQSGGGGLLSTAADYARFVQMLLNGGRLDGVRLLGRHTVAAMTSDHLLALPRAGELLPVDHGFGLGFAVKTHAGGGTEPGSVGSYGWSGSAGTAFFVEPAHALFAMVFTQAPGAFDQVRETFRPLVYAALDD